MRPGIALILSFFVLSFVPDKGMRGVYFLKGMAYDSNSRLLINQKLILSYGIHHDTISTGKNGEYKARVHWEFPCMTNAIIPGRITQETDEQTAIANANPRFIFFQYGGKTLKLRNFFYDFKDNPSLVRDGKLTYNQDLKFK